MKRSMQPCFYNDRLRGVLKEIFHKREEKKSNIYRSKVDSNTAFFISEKFVIYRRDDPCTDLVW